MKSRGSKLRKSAVLGAVLLLLVVGESAHAQERRVYSFLSQSGDGYGPTAGLIDVDGTLFGTTYAGGGARGCQGGCGTVFSFDLTTGKETVLHSFAGGPDGANPSADLVDVNGTLYGTTFDGGTSSNCYGGCGTVFSLKLSTGTYGVLYSFTSDPDGSNPSARLIAVNGLLYGTTQAGGGQAGCGIGCGTVFSLDPKTGTETVLHAFCSENNCRDGAEPFAGMIAVRGKLYGTTSAGGKRRCGDVNGCGTVFSLDLGTGREKAVYSFCSQTNCADGYQPYGGLVDVKGTLYGTTRYGAGGGTVFSVDPETSVEKVLHSFGSDGPQTGLIDVQDVLYGTTGGTSSVGTVFSLNIGTGEETVLYSFCRRPRCKDGREPLADLLSVKGRLYGTTLLGGRPPGDGVIFWVKRP